MIDFIIARSRLQALRDEISQLPPDDVYLMLSRFCASEPNATAAVLLSSALIRTSAPAAAVDLAIADAPAALARAVAHRLLS